MDDEMVEEMVLAERTLIAEDICEWFEIAFKSYTMNRKTGDFQKGHLIGLLYALKSCDYLSYESLDQLVDIILFKMPINRWEDHKSYIFQ